jgi:MFS superfamily sulfate permease-like transporter
MKYLFNRNTPTLKILLINFNTSLSLSLMSLPIAMSIVLSLDDRLPSWELDKIPVSIGIMTLLIGYLISFLISGSKTSFRTFSGSQYSTLSDSVSTLGIGCIAGMSLSGFIFNFLLYVTKKGTKIINYFPSHILEGLRGGTCLYLIVPEIYTLFRIPEENRVKHVNIIAYIISIMENSNNLVYIENIIGLTFGIGMYKFHKNFPKIPWFFIVGVLGAMYGIL